MSAFDREIRKEYLHSKLIILDRDGVINKNSKSYIKNKNEWAPIEGSIKAISRLSEHGFKILVATNQSGIGRGLFNNHDLDKIHLKMSSAIRSMGGHIEGIYYCPHKPEDGCNCRKPKTGLIDKIEKKLNIKVEKAILIGDSMSDIILANSINALPILLKTGNGEATLKELKNTDIRYLCFDNLAEATKAILKLEML